MSRLMIAGYASLFGVLDLAGDVVEKGAFAASLQVLPARSIAMLFQHDPNQPIGTWTEAYEDRSGLWVSGWINEDIAGAKAVATLVQNGLADGLSIGFRALDAQKRLGGGRILKAIDLREISVVSFPMLPRARLRVRPATPASIPLQSAA